MWTFLILSVGFGFLVWYGMFWIKQGEILQTKVTALGSWQFLETRWAYVYIHLFTVIPVFLLSFDRRVAYYKKWSRLVIPLIAVAIFFIAWDIFFTNKGIWGFNSKYITGLHISSLPMEEVLFFLTVPFACVFIYECLNSYFPGTFLGKQEPLVTTILAGLFFLTAMFNFDKAYTFTTFLLAAIFLVLNRWWFSSRVRDRFYLAYLVSLVPFLLVNGILTGGLMKEPIVVYNPDAFMGVRIFTIPIEDSIYGFLLLMLVVFGFEARASNMN
jgi:lycopene cyclase domain-containing protein